MSRTKAKSDIDVDHLADLANLTIAPDEKDLIEKQLEQTIDYVAVLDELDTSGDDLKTKDYVPLDEADEDTPVQGLSQKEALKNAPADKDGYFVVEKIKWGN